MTNTGFIEIEDSAGTTRFIRVAEIEEVESTPDIAAEFGQDAKVKCVLHMRSGRTHDLHVTAEDFMQRIDPEPATPGARDIYS